MWKERVGELGGKGLERRRCLHEFVVPWDTSGVVPWDMLLVLPFLSG